MKPCFILRWERPRDKKVLYFTTDGKGKLEDVSACWSSEFGWVEDHKRAHQFSTKSEASKLISLEHMQSYGFQVDIVEEQVTSEFPDSEESTESKALPQKATIKFETLETLDIRFCRIKTVTEILKNPKNPPSETNPVKAYKLLIDTGLDERECVTNLISYAPKELEGIVTPFILNLPEADIRGVRSRAMILAASSGDRQHLLSIRQGFFQTLKHEDFSKAVGMVVL